MSHAGAAQHETRKRDAASLAALYISIALLRRFYGHGIMAFFPMDGVAS